MHLRPFPPRSAVQSPSHHLPLHCLPLRHLPLHCLPLHCLPLRCLIVEEQLMFQDLLSGMLRLHPYLDFIGSVGTAAEAIAACVDLRPDLLILDLPFPDGDGFAVTRALQVAQRQARVIVLADGAGSVSVPAEFRPMITAILDPSQPFLDLLRAVEALLLPLLAHQS